MWLLTELPLQFYTLIPHRLGRSKAEMAAAIIDTVEKLEEKQELLQLMKDVLKVQHQAFAHQEGYHAHNTLPLLLTQLAQVMSHVRSGRELGGAYPREEEDLEVQIKYKALNCAISHVSHGSPEFKGIKKMISTAAHPLRQQHHHHHHHLHNR